MGGVVPHLGRALASALVHVHLAAVGPGDAASAQPGEHVPDRVEARARRAGAVHREAAALVHLPTTALSYGFYV